MFDTHERSFSFFVLSLIATAVFAPTAAWVWIVTLAFFSGIYLPRLVIRREKMTDPSRILYLWMLAASATFTFVLITLLPATPVFIPWLIPQSMQSPGFFHAFSGLEMIAAIAVFCIQNFLGALDRASDGPSSLSRFRGHLSILCAASVLAFIDRWLYVATHPGAHGMLLRWIITCMIVCLVVGYVCRKELRADLSNR